MAKKKEDNTISFPKGTKFYRNRKRSGLHIRLKPGKTKKTTKFEVFKRVTEKWQGDTVYVGYLATVDKKAIKLCDADSSCESIDKDEFVESVGEVFARVRAEELKPAKS